MPYTRALQELADAHGITYDLLMAMIDFYVRRNDAFHADLREMVETEDVGAVEARLSRDEEDIASSFPANSVDAKAVLAAVSFFRNDFLPVAKARRLAKLRAKAEEAEKAAKAEAARQSQVGGEKKKGKKGKGKAKNVPIVVTDG
jgi:hypothetical protein